MSSTIITVISIILCSVLVRSDTKLTDSGVNAILELKNEIKKVDPRAHKHLDYSILESHDPIEMPFKSIDKNSKIDIKLRNGLIRGLSYRYDNKLFNVFRGIRYAVPPVGDFRFRKSILNNKDWPGIYDATTFKSSCAQPPGAEVPTPSEDCLYLNIWAPVMNRSTGGLSVMVFLQGGVWTRDGSVKYENGTNVYDGTQLASNGVIVVTINFRLGVFGFLFGDSESAPGNVGFWDHLTAIQWIISNINAFGGNPNDITLFGRSSGAITISCLSVSPIVNGLFQKAIIQSGTSYPKHRLSSKSDSLEFSRRFATNRDYFGDNVCNVDNEFVNCLKNKSVEELVSAVEKMWILAEKENKFFKPLYGDELLPFPLYIALREGMFNPNTSFLIGHQELEGLEYILQFASNQSIIRYNPKTSFTENISKDWVKRDISDEFVYIRNRTVQLETARLYTNTFSDNQTELLRQQNRLKFASVSAFGDCIITCPTVIFGADIAINSEYRKNLYQYRLTYANSQSISYNSSWAAAKHKDEFPLMFGRPLNLSDTNWTDSDRYISYQMVKIWTHFAKNGHPPLVNGQTWIPYTRASDGSANASYLELHAEPSRLGRMFVNRYKGRDGYQPEIINNCLNYWKPIYINEYLNS